MPDEPFEVVDAEGILARLRSPRPALESIGAYLLSRSQQAFVDQRFGDFEWPERYPNQSEPFLNFAGALSDLNVGRNVRARRMDRRPALQDEGNLLRSLNFRVSGRDVVEVGVQTGPAREYASKHQQGGRSTQPISPGARDRLKRQIRGTMSPDFREALGKLDRVLEGKTALETDIVQRPFVGIPDEEARRDIREIVVDFVSGGSQ